MVKLPLRSCGCRWFFFSCPQLGSPSLPLYWNFIGDVIAITVSLVSGWGWLSFLSFGWLRDTVQGISVINCIFPKKDLWAMLNECGLCWKGNVEVFEEFWMGDHSYLHCRRDQRCWCPGLQLSAPSETAKAPKRHLLLGWLTLTDEWGNIQARPSQPSSGPRWTAML